MTVSEPTGQRNPLAQGNHAAQKKAVHFGAGNIGRGFVGLVLHRAGYELVFADVNAELIDSLATTPSYRVIEVGEGAETRTVDNYRALNSATEEDAVIAEVASADLVTTAVGPTVLRFIAPVIAAALAVRPDTLPPLVVMACENAINATDLLKEAVFALLEDPAHRSRAVFANTAVDRIVPGQQAGGELDVTVEAFFEWVIESGPFSGSLPAIPEAHFVEDLAPYIERKLFTVNTGHAATAYNGYLAGAATIAEALEIPEVLTEVRAVLEETKTLLVAKHDFAPEVQQEYLETTLRRFSNEGLSDTVERVGRQPLRKLGRHERFVGPAAELAERGIVPEAILRTMAAALRFDVADDPQSAELAAILATATAEQAARAITGLEDEHPLFPAVLKLVEERRRG